MTITKIPAGLSGAGVYRVDEGGEAYVLKVSAASEPLEAWRARRAIQRAASDAGVAPRVIEVDEAKRSVLSAFIEDRSFPMYYFPPPTRDTAIALLASTLRRVHELPLPADAPASDPREALATLRATFAFPLPVFVDHAIARILDETPPPREGPDVTSHNDVNPSNLCFDGTNLVLLDWDTAGANEALFDLATIAMFLRMDDATSARLLGGAITPRFAYLRRLVAVLCGATFLKLANGCPPSETLDSTMSLVEVYQQLRSGAIVIARSDGQWRFGLALVKASTEL